MRKILALLFGLLASPTFAADNYNATPGTGLVFGAKDATGILYSRFILCDNTTVAQCLAVDASGRLSLIPNTAMNIAQINGVTPLMGQGATGTGSPRVTIANDNTVPTGWPTAANQTIVNTWAGGTLGAMANYGTSPGAVLAPGVNAAITNTPTVTANAGTNLNTSALALAATQGATTAAPATVPTTTSAETEISLLKAITNLGATPLDNSSVAINVSTATTTQLVALSGATLIRVTSFDVIAGGTGNITFVYGTGTNCGTGTASLTGPYNLTAQAGIAKGSGIGTILKVPSGNALCVTTSAAVQMSGSVSYQQF